MNCSERPSWTPDRRLLSLAARALFAGDAFRPAERRRRAPAAGRPRRPRAWADAPALDARLQLHPAHGHQHARDVAGGDLRSGHHRPGARLGRGPRLQCRPRLPALPPLGAGRRRLPAAPRAVPGDRRPPPHRDDVRPLRRLLEPQVRARPAAGAAAGRPQLGLGPVPRPGPPRKPRPLGRPRGLRQGRHRLLPRRPPRPGLGPLQRARQLGLRIEVAAPGPERLRLGPRRRPGPAPDGRHLGRIEGARRAQQRSRPSTPTSSPSTPTRDGRGRRAGSPRSRPTTARSSAPSTWPGRPAAASRTSCRSSRREESGP